MRIKISFAKKALSHVICFCEKKARIFLKIKLNRVLKKEIFYQSRQSKSPKASLKPLEVVFPTFLLVWQAAVVLHDSFFVIWTW